MSKYLGKVIQDRESVKVLLEESEACGSLGKYSERVSSSEKLRRAPMQTSSKLWTEVWVSIIFHVEHS